MCDENTPPADDLGLVSTGRPHKECLSGYTIGRMSANIDTLVSKLRDARSNTSKAIELAEAASELATSTAANAAYMSDAIAEVSGAVQDINALWDLVHEDLKAIEEHKKTLIAENDTLKKQLAQHVTDTTMAHGKLHQRIRKFEKLEFAAKIVIGTLIVVGSIIAWVTGSLSGLLDIKDRLGSSTTQTPPPSTPPTTPSTPPKWDLVIPSTMKREGDDTTAHP